MAEMAPLSKLPDGIVTIIARRSGYCGFFRLPNCELYFVRDTNGNITYTVFVISIIGDTKYRAVIQVFLLYHIRPYKQRRYIQNRHH